MAGSEGMTGYPSVDKPWLKYYSEEALSTPLPECTIYEYLWENNKDRLDGFALNYYGRRITYRELFALIDRAASAFMTAGVKPKDTVTLVMLSCVPTVISLYALNKIGAIADFVNVLASEQELEELIANSGSRYLVTLDVFGEKAVRAAERCSVERIVVCSLGDYMSPVSRLVLNLKLRKLDRSFMHRESCVTWMDFLSKAGSSERANYSKNPRETCLFAHTGGTTGKPKTALLPDIALNVITQNYLLSMPHERGDVFLNIMIPYVIYGLLINIHMPLCLSLETVLVPRFSPSDWPKYIKKYKPHHCCSIPAYVAPMLKDEKLASFNLSGLFTVGVGGEGMNPMLERELNSFLSKAGSPAFIQKGYGMTEVGATAVSEFKNAHKTGSVGIPLMRNVVMAYNNESEAECRYGEAGELCMQCSSAMLGYKDDKAEERKLFKTHADGSVWLHTGDIGYVDEDGFIFLQGRMKRMIMTVVSGAVYKISPLQVEEAIENHPLVKEACVVGLPHGEDLLLKACVTSYPDANKDALEEELRSLCDKRLSENMRPLEYEFLDAMPRTAAGKIDYRAIEHMALEEA